MFYISKRVLKARLELLNTDERKQFSLKMENNLKTVFIKMIIFLNNFYSSPSSLDYRGSYTRK